MHQTELERLRFRRQYLLAPKSLQCPFQNRITKVSDTYFLYSHLDLNVTEYNRDSLKIILLGDMFDFENPSKSNLEILHDLLSANLQIVLEKSSKYSGRFVIIYSKDGRLFLFHDATATRKIYHCCRNGQFWFGSQPHLLATILGFNGTGDSSKYAYYHSEDLVNNFNGNVGDTTYYDEVSQLLPNHYFAVDTGLIKRYWPDKIIQAKPLKAVASHSARMIKGIVESIASRYNIMLPLTAGKDSRTLLAAASGISDRIYIYSNRMSKMKDDNRDIIIPKKLLSGLDLNFNLLDPYIPVDDEFKKVYFENNPFASTTYLPIIYNYYVNYPDRVNLPGNTVADQEYIYNVVKKKLTAQSFSELSGLAKYEFADKYFHKWYHDAYNKCLQYRINPMSLFYWENRLTNSCGQIQIDKDIAQEEFSPFNSRQLISNYLSVKPKHNISPDYRLHREVMKKLWPAVLKVPINPSRNNSLKAFFKIFGLLRMTYTLRHSLSRFL